MPETPDNSHPNSGVADQKADQRNDYDPAFSDRIEQVIGLAGSVAELARKAGLSERVISKASHHTSSSARPGQKSQRDSDSTQSTKTWD